MYYTLFGLLFCVSAVLGVGSALDSHETTYWGTFVVHGCEIARSGCREVGTWVSDDEAIVKKGIALDGTTASDGTARASFTPGGFNNDSENNIVHTSLWFGAKLWAPWVLCAIILAFGVLQARTWRRRRSR
jgi:hypothetical protein